MGRYLTALKKRGYEARVSPTGKLLLPRNMPEALRDQCIAAREQIIAELQESAPAVRDSRTAQPATPNRHYADPRHDLEECTEAWGKLFAVAHDSGVSVWFWDLDEPRPPEPYCFVKPVLVGQRYLYWPILREGGVEYFWAPASLTTLDDLRRKKDGR